MDLQLKKSKMQGNLRTVEGDQHFLESESPALMLKRYHPIIIEGMSGYDTRDPDEVSRRITDRLLGHWSEKAPTQPLLVLTQGDPLESSGISAITPRVAERLSVPRGLVYLDAHLAHDHWLQADRDGMVLEVAYSELVDHLDQLSPNSIKQIEAAIDEQIDQKNRERAKLGKDRLRNYYRDFALLQEVTKATCSKLCDGITIIHTSADIPDSSVTSFFTVGLNLGLVDSDNMVSYSSV